MQLFVLGLRRSGTTILYDALREDSALRCFYEPLREQAKTEGGGSGARSGDAFAETRQLRERFRRERFPELEPEDFNWGGPRAPELELQTDLPEHCRELLSHLLAQGPDVVIKETRLHHKAEALSRIAPEATLVHLVRDPRAVTASMLLGRRRRFDIYPDADVFFSARTGRKLWASRRISEELLADPRSKTGELPADVPDFLRPLLVWRSAFAALHEAGREHFGERYALVRLEDLRADPAATLARIYGLAGRSAPPEVTRWAAANVRETEDPRYADDPRWAKAARLIGLEPQLREAGYEEILELAGSDAETLNLTPARERSRLSGVVGRARRRLAGS